MLSAFAPVLVALLHVFPMTHRTESVHPLQHKVLRVCSESCKVQQSGGAGIRWDEEQAEELPNAPRLARKT